MKRGLFSLTVAGAICSAASFAFAGAYETVEQPNEGPVAPPAEVQAEVKQEEVEEDTIRKWTAFSTDAETSRGLWIETGLLYAHEEVLQDKPGEGELDSISSFLRIAYGQELWEAGVEVSYDWERVELDGPPGGDIDFDDNGFGDLDVWGKVIPLRTKYVNLGGGLVVSTPTGESDFRGFQTYRGAFTTDEFGFNPFLTANFLAGPVHIRTAAGYQLYTGMDDFNGLDYNVAFLIPLGDMFTVRTELDGFHFCDNGSGAHFSNDEVLDFMPGFDVRFPMGSAEVMIRPTGSIGLTHDSRDWGLGLSFAVTGLGG